MYNFVGDIYRAQSGARAAVAGRPRGSCRGTVPLHQVIARYPGSFFTRACFPLSARCAPHQHVRVSHRLVRGLWCPAAQSVDDRGGGTQSGGCTVRRRKALRVAGVRWSSCSKPTSGAEQKSHMPKAPKRPGQASNMWMTIFGRLNGRRWGASALRTTWSIGDVLVGAGLSRLLHGLQVLSEYVDHVIVS